MGKEEIMILPEPVFVPVIVFESKKKLILEKY
jgi:hypothetical protein